MDSSPRFDLRRLREIGWSEWDPQRILVDGDSWENHPEFADEYDDYLLHAAFSLWGGWSLNDAAEYFVRISRDHMALGVLESKHRRSALATAIAIGQYLDEFPVRLSPGRDQPPLR